MTIDDSSEAWRRGEYPWWSQDAGRSLNMASLLGHHTLAIQALDARVTPLDDDVAALRARIAELERAVITLRGAGR